MSASIPFDFHDAHERIQLKRVSRQVCLARGRTGVLDGEQCPVVGRCENVMDADLSLQKAIQEHLELTRRNEALAETMPLDRYLEHPPAPEPPSDRSAADPWHDGLWSAPLSFDWGD